MGVRVRIRARVRVRVRVRVGLGLGLGFTVAPPRLCVKWRSTIRAALGATVW